MTTENIKLNPTDAAGTFGQTSGQLSGQAGAPNTGAVRPGVQGSLEGLNGSFQNTLDRNSQAFNTGSTASTAMGESDKDSAGRVRGGPDAADPTKGSGGRGGGPAGGESYGKVGAPRLTTADLAKAAANPYQSAMPMVQNAAQAVPSMAQSLPGMLSSPLQAASGAFAPFQSMLAGPGGNQLLDQMLARGNAANGFDGGPASLPMGTATGADGQKLQSIAKNLIGMPYAWGGGHGGQPGPSQGISDGGGPADRAGDYNKIGLDCSGLSRFVAYQMHGIDVGGTSESQYSSGTPVSASEARPGDFAFPASAGRPPGHVQVYMGGGQVLEAPSSGQTVKISPLAAGTEFRRFAA